MISLGTDTTDLVVTNGYRVWQRNIPIGGNHFTRALSKELKLTFAKAEHLKRNATQADDPKAVFQAMRPVFSDLLAEIQRSLGYFKSIDKSAKIGDVIALGNAMKLPGLQRYLAQNLEQPVQPIEEFAHLSAGSASGARQFKENTLSFAPAYGLCIQGLGKAEIQTNLLPEEIIRTRLIRSKKPWALAGAAALMLGFTVNYFTHYSAWSETQTDAMNQALQKADSVTRTVSTFDGAQAENKTKFEEIQAAGEALVSNVEGRLLWLELAKAIDAATPRDDRPLAEREETKEDIEGRVEIHITAFDQQRFEDVGSEWWTSVESLYWDSKGGRPGEGEDGDGDATEDYAADDYASDDEAGGEGGDDLTGAGWVVQLTGYHYHNAEKNDQTSEFVERTLIKSLEEGVVQLPDGPNGQMIDVPISDLGISKPFIFQGKQLTTETRDPEAEQLGETGGMRGGGAGFDEMEGGYGGYGGFGGPGAAGEDPMSSLIELSRFDFVVQFAWIPTPRSARLEIAEQRRIAEQEAAEQRALEEADQDPADLPVDEGFDEEVDEEVEEPVDDGASDAGDGLAGAP